LDSNPLRRIELLSHPGAAVVKVGHRAARRDKRITRCRKLCRETHAKHREDLFQLAERVRSRHQIPCDVTSASEAVTNSNLICTCTPAETPLFDGGLIRPGTHINAVGAFTPQSRELDTAAVLRARVIVDARSADGHKAGDIQIPISEGAITAAHIKGTLSDLVLSKASGRESSEEISLFKSSGLAIEDLVTAQLAFDRAVSSGIGTQVSL